jgi:hypothetical protein
VADDQGMAKRAESIAVDKLSRAVDDAVREVSAKHGLKMGDNLVFKPGLLIGRQVLEKISDLDAAQKLAADVASQVQKAGFAGGGRLAPGVLVLDRTILVGYFPMEQVFEVSRPGG